MGEFTFDTSGVVDLSAYAEGGPWLCRWPDLSPFEQGYTRAALRAFSDLLTDKLREPLFVGFSDFAPETLEAIRRDCAAITWRVDHTREQGAAFWHDRQVSGRIDRSKDFPPLTITLHDDGKVYLRPARSPGPSPDGKGG